MSTADSLILDDTVELLLGGAVSAHPRCPGAVMVLAPGFSRGAGAPDTEVVQSLLLDGERPKGRRTSNRTITLPIKISGPSRAILNGAKELLLDIVDQERFRLTWTPDPQGGTPLPLVFDCYRQTEATPVYDQDMEDQLVTYVSLTFPAHPFGRSSDFTTLKFPTPAVSWTTPPSPVRVDDFSTVSTSTQPSMWAQSSQNVADSFSARWSFAASGGTTAPLYTRTLAAPVDITGLDRIALNFGLGTSNYVDWHSGRITFVITISDNSGHTLSLGNHVYCSAGNNPAFPLWQPVTFTIPASATFDFAHLSSYTVQAWRRVNWLGQHTLDSDAYLNGLTASASAAAAVPTLRGTVYRIAAPGTARSLMSAEFQPALPPVLTPQTATFTTPGAFSWLPPVGATISSVLVQGASGKGGTRTTSGAGGGAGGGASVTVPNYPCTPGQAMAGFVGAAGTSGGFPLLAASYTVTQDGNNAYTLVTPSFTPAANEVIVVKGITADGFSGFGTPSGGSLSYTSRASIGSTNFSHVQLWTAVVGGSPTAMTVSLPFSGYPLPHAMVVERWINAQLAGSPATGTGSGTSTAPSATVTTAANNSIVSWVNADRTFGSGARTYRSSATEDAYHVVSSVYAGYTGYWAYQTAASSGAQTIGLTAPASQKWTIAGIEIQALNTGGLADGAASSFDSLAIVAAGGKSVADNTATGGLGGTTAACVVPAGGTARRGGNGATGSTTGGGGGGGADDSGQGGDGSGATAGAAGGANAGAGGTGGAAGGNNAGGAGVAPAGAGAGAFSTGGSAAGGAGANGKVTITYLAPLPPFHTLLVHAPGYSAPALFSPLIPAGSGLDAPDGREYTVPSPVGSLNARFYGTYTVFAFFSNIDTPSASRTLTVSFKQYAYPGGPSDTVAAVRTLTPTTEDPPIVNGVVAVDTVTLPPRDIADDQTAAYMTVGVTSTNANDRLLDIVLVDVTGQLLLVNVSGTGYPSYWWDSPESGRDWGRVLGSTYDRAQAVSVLDSVAAVGGGPLMVDPDGPGWLLAYSPDAGAPALTAGLWARWRDSRLA